MNMKKLALTIAIVLGLGLCSYAQNAGFFGYGTASEKEDSNDIAWYSFYQDQEVDNGLFGHIRAIGDNLPNLPDHGSDDNNAAPLGGGSLLLIGLGAAYALKKRNSKR